MLKRIALLAAIAALSPVAATAEPVATADPAITTFREGLAACSLEQWSDEAFAAKGFQRGAHYSLREPGQRVQSYERAAGGDGISLHSSLMLYISCSTGVDLASPDAFVPTRNALVSELGLHPTSLTDVAFSDSAKAYMKFEDIKPSNEAFASERYVYVFGFRQFDGRNRMYVNVIRREKGNQ
jgi:hypothetical protein